MKKLVSWVEIPAEKFDRAVKFYESVFGNELNVFESENEKMACFPGGEGAISFSPGFKPSVDGVLLSIDVGSEMDSTIQKIKQAGGNLSHPKTKIEAEGRGYFALFHDSEGNRLGLHGE